MKKLLPFLIIIFCSATVLFAQDHQDSLNIPSDSIYMFKSFFGPQYYYQEQRINFNQIDDLLFSDPELLTKYNYAYNFNRSSRILSSIGYALIGWSVAMSVIGENDDWTPAIFGGGLVVLSIPFNIGYINRADEIITEYNSGLQEKLTGKHPLQMHLGFARCGLSLKMQF